ncbi:hypothetical protein BDQ17DRAFT_1324209 [Cyathus striatus]|nr:hypothetical protein BDQ17DRAFT_1324209 [Cyathus striatus]
MNWYHKFSGPKKNQTKTMKHFNQKYPDLQLKQPVLSNWLKHEDMWQEWWTKHLESGSCLSGKCFKPTEFPVVTKMFELWVEKALHDHVCINGDVLWEKWK